MVAKAPDTLSRRLYFEHAVALGVALSRLGVPRAEIEDTVHDVFLIAVRRPEAVAAARSPRAWLFGIAVKLAATRRRWHRLKTFLSLDSEEGHSEQSSPHRQLEQRQATDSVQAALATLGGRKRDVFVLFELEGLSGAEIAETLDCPVNTVWTRLFHARKEFAAAISRQPRGSFEALSKGEEV